MKGCFVILERDCLKGGDNTCVRVSRGTAEVLPSDRFTRGKRRIMNVSLYHTAREITSKPACGACRARSWQKLWLLITRWKVDEQSSFYVSYFEYQDILKEYITLIARETVSLACSIFVLCKFSRDSLSIPPISY